MIAYLVLGWLFVAICYGILRYIEEGDDGALAVTAGILWPLLAIRGFFRNALRLFKDGDDR